jgi:hypothetical protein
MLQLGAYICRIGKKKIANSDAITDTQNDSDWEEIETQ